MALTSDQCKKFHDYLGRRPYPWDTKIAKDRHPREFIYAGMYKSSPWASFTGTEHLWEKVHVARPNDNGMWTQFQADPCLGAPCDVESKYIGHGVTQYSYGHYKTDYRSAVFCLDQLNTIQEAPKKLDAIVQGYKKVPEDVCGTFLRYQSFKEAGTAAEGAGLWLVGVQDAYGNPANIDMTASMFSVSQGGAAGSKNNVFINLNAGGALTTLATAGKISAATTAGLIPYLSQLTMEYLGNHQEDLAGCGYTDSEWAVSGKFQITMDETTGRRLHVANPELSKMYSVSDFSKGGAFYGYGLSSGCGDWLFKKDPQQLRFRFRADLDGKDLAGNSLSGAVWIENVQPFENVAASYGIKPQFSPEYKAAPIRIYHCFHREARETFVGDVTSVNSEMKFGLPRSFMGQWTWKHPHFFKAFDPQTGSVCEYDNVKDNKGFFLGEYDLGIKTVYPEIERWFLALGEATPYVRRPNTVTPATAPSSYTDYQSLLAYNDHCADTSYTWSIEDV